MKKLFTEILELFTNPFPPFQFKKAYRRTLKEIEQDLEREKKLNQWCENVIDYFKCSECKKQATVISNELKYCNTCGFSFSNKLHKV